MKCVVSRSPYATSSVAAAGTTPALAHPFEEPPHLFEAESEHASVSVLAAPLQKSDRGRNGRRQALATQMSPFRPSARGFGSGSLATESSRVISGRPGSVAARGL